jgi:hypothetical protein
MRVTTGKTQIVPGVVGPTEIKQDNFVIPTTHGGMDVELTVRFDHGRYVCTEMRATGDVITEAVRQVRITEFVTIMLLLDPVMTELPNPRGIDPWGLQVPADVREAPTSRSLKWVAHIYAYGLAIGTPTKAVEELIELPRATASRWVRIAKEQGYIPESPAV